MNERPILFSAPMVRAILDGTKRQTRRMSGLARVNEHPDEWTFDRWQDGYPDGRPRAVFVDREGEPIGLVCPYGSPGDRLWVRETWRVSESNPLPSKGDVHYRADLDEPPADGCWRPSIFMPRWASRITRTVESVRVERLHDITEEDASAEGVTPAPFAKAGRLGDLLHVEAFEDLWTEINGAESWQANPWVWVVGFSRVAVSHG